MPTIKLPDGKNLTFSSKVTGYEVAEKISKSLSKQALVISVDGQLKDLDYLIEKDCAVRIFTAKDKKKAIHNIFCLFSLKLYNKII